jgi:hypothetical protein
VKRGAASFLTLLVAACSSAPPGDPAPVTFYGKALGLERWKAIVVERSHYHADLTDAPCPMPGILNLTDGMAGALSGVEKRDADTMGRALGSLMEQMCCRQHQPVYGGADRLVLALSRFGEDPLKPFEAVILDFPRLKPDEKERLFKTGEFAAAWERPPKTVEATIQRGWTRVIRRPSGYEFEIFLVLAGSGEPTQIVARVEVDAR